MRDEDWAAGMFPGDGFEIPDEAERDRADALIVEWSARWREEPIVIPRVHPDVSFGGFADYLAGQPTNRAFLRSRLRRWWHGPGRPLANAPENVQQKLSDNPLSN